MNPISNLDQLLRQLEPELHTGIYIFSTVPSTEGIDEEAILMRFREEEGITLILPRAYADENAFPYAFEAAWITLRVHSSLEAVGLTAAISAALTQAGISCNIVAGFYHDHLFVPYARATDTVRILQQISENARGGK
jgi:uncharacterized protein